MAGKTRECPSCASEIPADQNACYLCGYEFPSRGGSNPAWIKWVAALIALLFLIPLLRALWR
jgi:predicted amidophosphoribosyltransferase